MLEGHGCEGETSREWEVRGERQNGYIASFDDTNRKRTLIRLPNQSPDAMRWALPTVISAVLRSAIYRHSKCLGPTDVAERDEGKGWMRYKGSHR